MVSGFVKGEHEMGLRSVGMVVRLTYDLRTSCSPTSCPSLNGMGRS